MTSLESCLYLIIFSFYNKGKLTFNVGIKVRKMTSCLSMNSERPECFETRDCLEICERNYICGVVIKNETGLEIQVAGCLVPDFCPSEPENDACHLRHSKRAKNFDLFSCCCTKNFCNNNTVHNSTLMTPIIPKTTTTTSKYF